MNYVAFYFTDKLSIWTRPSHFSLGTKDCQGILSDIMVEIIKKYTNNEVVDMTCSELTLRAAAHHMPMFEKTLKQHIKN